MSKLPQFRFSLLHPRHWLTWSGIGLLYLLVLLPYPLIYQLGRVLGWLSMRIMKQRVNITRRNLALCFPTMSATEREQLVVENFRSVGIGVMETGMAWFWSDRRIQRHFTVSGMEQVKTLLAQKQGILLIGIHFLTLELGARIFGIHTPGIGVYRPNDNPLLDWLQAYGRLRSNKTMLDRNDLKGMVKALKSGEIVWYAPDHDYGPRNSVFVPLFAVPQAATTSGSWMLAKLSGACIVPFVPRRNANGRGYQLIILPAESQPPLDNATITATWLNHIVERCIMLAPDQYMWLHRRFKTRPPGEPDYYS